MWVSLLSRKGARRLTLPLERAEMTRPSVLRDLLMLEPWCPPPQQRCQLRAWHGVAMVAWHAL